MKKTHLITFFLIFLLINLTLTTFSHKLISNKPEAMHFAQKSNDSESKVTTKGSTDDSLILKFEPPPAYPDDGRFTYSTVRPASMETSELVENFEELGYIGNTIASDDVYYIGHIDTKESAFYVDASDSVDEAYWYDYFGASIPAHYLGTITIEYEVEALAVDGYSIKYTYTDTFEASSDCIINGHIHIEIKAKFYGKSKYLEVGSETYRWDYCEIDTFIYLTKWDGTKDLVISHDNDEVEYGTDDSTEAIKDCYLRIDQVKLTTTYYHSNVIPEHINFDDHILHKVQFEVPYAGTKITFLNLPRNWVFYNSSPIINFNDQEKSFYAIIEGTYTLYFVSYDLWNYPQYELSRVSFFNSRGEFLPFDSFHTYIAESPTRLIRYAPDIQDDDLICWFRFNEGTGSVTYDWKNNLQGTIYGATWVTGYIGEALSYDGVDDYVLLPTDFLDGYYTSYLTIELWFKPLSYPSGDRMIFSIEGVWFMYFLTDGRIRTDVDGSSSSPTLYSASKLMIDQWYHIAITYDGETLYLYINGRLESKVDQTIYDITSLTRTSAIGSQYDGSTLYINGIIDEVRIYKRALSSEEVWWHYALVFYFDGFRDLMGREPYYDIPSVYHITQGVFGYATEVLSFYDSSGYPFYWLIDESISTIHDGYTAILFGKDFEQKSGFSWVDVFRFAGHRIEFHLTRSSTLNYYYYYDKGTGTLVGAFSVSQDTWNFIAVETYGDSADSIAFVYVNGEKFNERVISDQFGGIYFYDLDESDGIQWYEIYTILCQGSKGIVDEAIILREPLSKEMLDNLYYIAKQYIGGFYTDESFKATWDIEQDSPEDGNGFAESFADISEWSVGGVNNYNSESHTTDGDVATFYADFLADSVSGWVTWVNPLDSYIDVSQYPFAELRWKGETNASAKFEFKLHFTDGEGNYQTVWVKIVTGSFDWEIVRINAYEKIKSMVTWSNYYIYKIEFAINDYPDTDAQYGKAYIDWLRIYRIEGYGTWMDDYADGDTWISSIGGVIVFHDDCDTSNGVADFNYIRIDVPDVSTDNLYLELRAKRSAEGIGARLLFIVDGNWYGFVFEDDDWTIHRILLSQYGETLNYLYIGSAETSESHSTGDYYVYIDYIRIGYLQEKIHDTEWEALLYPLYEHPKNGYVWFNVTDIWGNVLAYEPRPYQPYQDFVFQVYSWKFKNNRDDTFVKISVQMQGSEFVRSEWVAPGEIVEYTLYPGTYDLTIEYPDGQTSTYTFDVSDDTFFLLTGYTLYDIISNQEEIMDQIVSVNITLLNVNSTIMNQVIDVNINLVNVNTTLYDLIIDTQNMVINVNTTIKQINETLYNEIINSNATITSMIIDLDNKIISINTTMETYYINITNQLDLVNSTLYNLILDVQTMVQQQNVTIYDMWVDLNNSIVAVNSSLGMMIIDLRNNITVMNTTIVDMLVNITDNIVLVQNDIYTLNETILLKFRDLDNNITQYFTTTWDKIATLDEMIRRFFNRFTWELYNPLTGLGIESELFRVYINDRRVFQHEYYTLADNVSIIVTDYWDRVWYNASHPANASIKIGIPVGRLIIYNDLDKDITVNITLKDDPQKRNITIVILKGTAVVLDLPLGDYYITVISIDYKTLKVELRTLLVSVALSDTGKEVVISQPEIHVDEGFWGKIKEEAPSYILHGFLFGLGSIAASLIFAAIWLTEKRRKQAEISLGTGPIRYSYQVTVTWKDIILITLLIICTLLIYLLLI